MGIMVSPRAQQATRITSSIDATHLLLSCMDHRCTDDIVREIGVIIGADQESAKERYDHLVLAGSSLGVLQTTYPAWGETFWEHLAIARKLHPKIAHVILLDHLECGAYRTFYPGYEGDPWRAHDEITRKLAAKIKEVHPDLEVHRWLLIPDSSGHTWYPRPLDPARPPTDALSLAQPTSTAS